MYDSVSSTVYRSIFYFYRWNDWVFWLRLPVNGKSSSPIESKENWEMFYEIL